MRGKYYFEYVPTIEEIKEYNSLLPLFNEYKNCINDLKRPIPYNYEPLIEFIKKQKKMNIPNNRIVPVISLLNSYYYLRTNLLGMQKIEYTLLISINDPENPFNYKERQMNGYSSTILKMIMINDPSSQKEDIKNIKKILKKLSKKFVSSCLNYGVYLFLVGKVEKQIRWYEKMILKQPSTESLFNLSCIYYNLDDFEKQKEYVERSMEFENPVPQSQILLYCLKKKDKSLDFVPIIW